MGLAGQPSSAHKLWKITILALPLNPILEQECGKFQEGTNKFRWSCVNVFLICCSEAFSQPNVNKGLRRVCVADSAGQSDCRRHSDAGEMALHGPGGMPGDAGAGASLPHRR